MVSSSSFESSIKEKIQNAVRAFRWNFMYLTFIILFLVLLLAWIFRYAIGFESSVYSIQRTLSETYETEHFIIHYAPEMFTRQEGEFAGLEHEFRLYQDKEALHIRFDGKITSYIYPDAETKRRFIGTGTTNIAKPWRKEIHLNKDSWQEVLKHELVHVLAGEFGLPIINAHYNIGLTEGLATAIDDDWGNRTLHEYAAAIKKFEIASHPERLISVSGFMTQASSLSYVLMGSFCKFLIDEYGIEKFKQLYGGSSVQTVYQKEYEELIQEWQSTIEKVAVPDSWKNHVEYFFRRQSIFAKECARTIARINEEGFRSLMNKQPEQAKALFQSSLEQSWNTQAFMGIISAEYSASKYARVIELMKKQEVDSSHKSPVAGILSTYGNSLWQTGDTANARIVFNKILEYDLSDRTNESALLRLEALNDTELANYLRPYFTSPASGQLTIAFIDSGLVKYSHPLLHCIKAKISFRLKKYRDVIQNLLPITYDLPPELQSSSNQLLGESYFWLKDYQLAEQCFTEELAMTTNQAARKRIEDWIKRCEWFGYHRSEVLSE
jgi:tetratricopeptide (TPR) repeat protein